MIRGISGGAGINVTGGAYSFPYINSGNSNSTYVGTLRLSNGNLEVFDGSIWRIIDSPYASVSLNQETEAIIAWARKKRNEELDRLALAEKSPAIKDLMNQIQEKENQIEMVMTLMKASGNEGKEQVTTGTI